MFKQIVSKLSLSPSAASELAFYARRLKQERVTRTFSALAAVLIIGLQFATIIAPPTPSNAASPSDIIHGGFVSKSDLLNRYDGSAELKALFNHFGISRADLTKSTTTNINSRDRSLNSIGRVQHAASDKPVRIGSRTYWTRYLYQFDTGNNIQRGSTYQVLQGKRSRDGGYFAVMFRCGNIVFKTIPVQPTPRPTPQPTPPAATPRPTPTPKRPTISCVRLNGSIRSGQPPLKVDFTGQGAVHDQTITEYAFNFGDNTSSRQTGPTTSHTYTAPGRYTATLTLAGSTGTVTPISAACSFTVDVEAPPAEFTKAKSALNLTQNIDATTAPARAGDTIRYTLSTKNVGGSAQSYEVVEHIEDVLEYADITDTTGATLSNGVLTWPALTITPGQTLVRTFTVKIKDPIPATPAGLSDPFSYDLRMDNIYGNEVRITLEPPLPKQVEAAATSLPQTGPATTTVVILLVGLLALYFYFRCRQLAAEVRILRHDYSGGNY